MKKTILALVITALTGQASATGCAMDSAFQNAFEDTCEKEPDLVEEHKAIEDKTAITYQEASNSFFWTTSSRHVRGDYLDAEAACETLVAVMSYGNGSALCDRDQPECLSKYEDPYQLYDFMKSVSVEGFAPCYTWSDPFWNGWLYQGFVFAVEHDWNKCSVIPTDSVAVVQVPWTEDPQYLSIDYAYPQLVGGLPLEKQTDEYGMTGPDGWYDSTIEMRAAGAPGDPNVYAFLTKADIRAALRYPDDWDGNAVIAVHNHSGTQAKKCLRFE